jgi:hypothetical protein
MQGAALCRPHLNRPPMPPYKKRQNHPQSPHLSSGSSRSSASSWYAASTLPSAAEVFSLTLGMTSHSASHHSGYSSASRDRHSSGKARAHLWAWMENGWVGERRGV